MTRNEATFPLSPPSWTWGDTSVVVEAPDDSDLKTEFHGRKTIACWTELPSRRWLVQASRRQ